MKNFNVTRELVSKIDDDIKKVHQCYRTLVWHTIQTTNTKSKIRKVSEKIESVFKGHGIDECVGANEAFTDYIERTLNKHANVNVQVIKSFLSQDEPLTITLCGSTKFGDGYDDWNGALTLRNNVVLSVSLKGHADNIELSPEEKGLLDHVHRCKIDKSQGRMFIVTGNVPDTFHYHQKISNIDTGYYGASTASEIQYQKHCKRAGLFEDIQVGDGNRIVFDYHFYIVAVIYNEIVEILKDVS